ncbi:MAG: septum formation initiator family protein [bacterium]
MPTFRRRGRFFFNKKTAAVAVFLFLLMIIFGLVREVLNRFQIDNQINILQNQLNELEKQNSDLNMLIGAWSGSSVEMEKQARLKLGLKKPGETTVLIVNETATSTNNQTASDGILIPNKPEMIGNIVLPANEALSNPMKWLNYFFDHTKK